MTGIPCFDDSRSSIYVLEHARRPKSRSSWHVFPPGQVGAGFDPAQSFSLVRVCRNQNWDQTAEAYWGQVSGGTF